MAGKNFGRQAQARARRDSKEHLALASAAVDAERLYKPPDECDCDVFPSEVRLDKTNRLHVTLYFHGGRLVRFFMAWQCIDREGQWVERYSVCTMHGNLHEHTTGHQTPNDARTVMWLYSQPDVQDCHDKAYDMVLNRYQFANGGTYG